MRSARWVLATPVQPAAITAALTGGPVSGLTGFGTGIQQQRREHKVAVIENALRLHFGDYRSIKPEPLEVLRCVGGLEIAAITGAVLGQQLIGSRW